MTIDIASLPTPIMLEELDAETIISEMMADIESRFTAAGVDYDVSDLEVDPVKIVVEASAARELKLRARFNDGLRANLVPLAIGSDLDTLAAFYDVTRLAEETDAALWQRVITAIIGRSPAGPEERYVTIAKSVAANIESVAVYREDISPNVFVAIYTSDNGGVPSSSLLEDVQERLDESDTRVVSDVITVVAAVTTVVDVEANVWLLPDTPQDVFDGLEQKLSDALDAEGGLGFDINLSWLLSKIHIGGVSKVELVTPSASVAIPGNEAATFGTITLNYKGRSR